MSAPPLAISLGDPAGIGPEVVLRALAERQDLEVVIHGDEEVLARAATVTKLTLPARAHVIPVTKLGATVVPGIPSDVSGRAQVAYLEAAVTAVLAGEARALVTAPISKEWAARAGFAFPGHTEYLAARAGVAEFAMMLAGPRLRVTLVTTHLPIAHVAAALSVDAIAAATVLTVNALRTNFGIAVPRVAVAALNPHGGEAGRFGDEEGRLIQPGIAVAQARLRAAGVEARVSGPHVPDAVFREAAGGDLDAVVAMYHDQALIPLKLIDFEDAVNLTLGLPFVRTSPDHGTAYDLAGTGRARHRSFLAALDLAHRLSRRADG